MVTVFAIDHPRHLNRPNFSIQGHLHLVQYTSSTEINGFLTKWFLPETLGAQMKCA